MSVVAVTNFPPPLADIVVVRESDGTLLDAVGAALWHRPEALSFGELKLQGNQLFVARDYQGIR